MAFRFILLIALAAQPLFVAPLMVGALAGQYGFSEQQLGVVAATNLTSFSLTFIWFYLRGHRYTFQNLIILAAGVGCLAHLLCMITPHYLLLVGLKFISGIAGGILYAVATVGISRQANSIRLFGWGMALQALVAVLLLVALPSLIQVFGIASLFFTLFITTLLCGLVTHHLPSAMQGANQRMAIASILDKKGAYQILAGIFLLYLGQGGYLAFIERIGADSGLAPDYIGYCLGASMLTGLLAGCLSAWQAERWGLRCPLLLVFLGQTLAIALLVESVLTDWGYLAAVMLYNFFWTYVVPFHLELLGRCDPSGRLVALAPALQGGGLALGAVVSGYLLQASSGYSLLLLFMAGAGLASLLVILSARGKPRKKYAGSEFYMKP